MVASFNFSTAPTPQVLSFGSATALFPACDLGPITADRIVVVGVGHDVAPSRIVNSITVGGNPAQQLVYTSSGAGLGSGLWSIADSVNATADIQVNFNVVANLAAIAVGELYGAVNAANQTNIYPSVFGPDPQAFATSVPVYQYGIGVATLFVGSTRGPPNWVSPANSVGFTVLATTANHYTIAMADYNTPAPWAPSVSGNTIVSTDSGSVGYGFQGAAMSMATWQLSGLITQIPMGGICL